MLKERMPAPTFAEAAMENRLDPKEPLLKLRDAVNWKPLESKLAKLYSKGIGRPAYAPLVLFRILLLQRWHDLSDPAMARPLRYNYLLSGDFPWRHRPPTRRPWWHFGVV